MRKTIANYQTHAISNLVQASQCFKRAEKVVKAKQNKKEDKTTIPSFP